MADIRHRENRQIAISRRKNLISMTFGTQMLIWNSMTVSDQIFF